MICISINQESRRLALVDMYNAASQCDLLEVRLDRFGMAPELGELLAHKPRPVIMACRRKQDGGQWDGTEEERLALLRQCIVSKAEYVEIELDAADQIRPYPPAKRVISYTNLKETPADVAEIYAQAQTKKPDVIKLVTLARTPEEAWPLVQILAKPPVPTVVVGLGKPGVMLTVLGKKIGAPWTYAALERGMEAWPGQPTVSDLESVYHYRAIDRATRLIGVTGFGDRERITVAAFNAVLAKLELPARCLPMGVGSMRLFRKVIDAVKLAGVVVDEEHQERILDIVGELRPSAQQAKAADVVLNKNETWYGYYTRQQAAVGALAATLKARTGADEPLRDRMVLIAGLGATAQALAAEIQQQGGSVILAGHERKAAQALAQQLGCRFVQWEAIYSTMHDVLIVAEPSMDAAAGTAGVTGIHPSYLKPGMTVMDLTANAAHSELLREAAARGCAAVSPRQLLLDQLELQTRLFTSKAAPREVLVEVLNTYFPEEE